MDSRQRAELLARIPWVTRLARSRQCDGKQGKCKLPAYWKFRALKRSWAASGTYCRIHLIHNGLYGDMWEDQRIQRWWERNGAQLCDELGIPR